MLYINIQHNLLAGVGKCSENAHKVNIKSQVLQKLHSLTSIRDKKSGNVILIACPSREAQISFQNQKPQPSRGRNYGWIEFKRKCL